MKCSTLSLFLPVLMDSFYGFGLNISLFYEPANAFGSTLILRWIEFSGITKLINSINCSIVLWEYLSKFNIQMIYFDTERFFHKLQKTKTKHKE